jgi:NifB/MoaA-like Fe-S oxidoreductase
MLLVPGLALGIGTGGCGPHARGVSHVVVIDGVDLSEVSGAGGSEDDVMGHDFPLLQEGLSQIKVAVTGLEPVLRRTDG